MKQFMDKDFLLSTPTAQHLFHDYADQMPIVDYHCHINPKEIAEDRKFENITQVWLGRIRDNRYSSTGKQSTAAYLQPIHRESQTTNSIPRKEAAFQTVR